MSAILPPSLGRGSSRGFLWTVLVRGFIAAVLVGAVARGLGGTATPVPPPTANFQPRLTNSVYQPTASRDPFLKSGENIVPAGSNEKPSTDSSTPFHLDGFLGASNDLVAIVNGWVLTLNKPRVLETATGPVQIKAVKITFDGVMLDVGGKIVELKRATAPPPPKPADRGSTSESTR